MSRGRKLLERMRESPYDWRIEDVLAICAALGCLSVIGSGG